MKNKDADKQRLRENFVQCTKADVRVNNLMSRGRQVPPRIFQISWIYVYIHSIYVYVYIFIASQPSLSPSLLDLLASLQVDQAGEAKGQSFHAEAEA